MPETKNVRLGLYGAEHSKCDHMITLGFKGLTMRVVGTPDESSRLYGAFINELDIKRLQRMLKTQPISLYSYICNSNIMNISIVKAANNR